jgi:hypothetical protein
VKKNAPTNPAKTPATRSHIKRLAVAAKKILPRKEHSCFVAMITLAFYGFLRPSEFCISPANHHLRWKSVKLGKHRRSLRLTLNSYKHSSQPSTITVAATASSCCPVKKFLAYSKTQGSVKKQPLFDVSLADFQSTLKHVAAVAKIKSHLTPHSFRHGGATWAAKAGWPDARIRAHGRWKSDAYKRYVRAS